MRIAVVTPEVVPFSKTGGLADVAGSLPRVFAEQGHQVAVFSPCYRAVMESGKYISFTHVEFPVKIGERIAVARLFRKRRAGVDYYFIENREFFDRDQLYGTPAGDYPDNLERFIFFCRAALEAMIQLELVPEIIHCHDWQAGLVPLYLRELYARSPALSQARTAFTIHNLGYQGKFPGKLYPWLGLPWEYFTAQGLEFYGQISLLKAGLVHSDLLTTVSPTYAQEIQTPKFGFGLDGVLRARAAGLHGIVNGIDGTVWNPATDKALAQGYDARDRSGKAEAKQALMRELKLAGPDRPLLGMIARLSAQKGLELLMAVADRIVALGANLAVLGTGEEKYHKGLAGLQAKLPGQVSSILKFDEPLAHRIYAGADLFLVPSQYEPCGLSQMIALRYGTVPIGFRTGGLADTIVDPRDDAGRANGFLFNEYTPAAFLERIGEALKVWTDREIWDKLVTSGMEQDYSWRSSARQYLELFRQALERGPTETASRGTGEQPGQTRLDASAAAQPRPD